jgi:hypothetical protein
MEVPELKDISMHIIKHGFAIWNIKDYVHYQKICVATNNALKQYSYKIREVSSSRVIMTECPHKYFIEIKFTEQTQYSIYFDNAGEPKYIVYYADYRVPRKYVVYNGRSFILHSASQPDFESPENDQVFHKLVSLTRKIYGILPPEIKVEMVFKNTECWMEEIYILRYRKLVAVAEKKHKSHFIRQKDICDFARKTNIDSILLEKRVLGVFMSYLPRKGEVKDWVKEVFQIWETKATLLSQNDPKLKKIGTQITPFEFKKRQGKPKKHKSNEKQSCMIM